MAAAYDPTDLPAEQARTAEEDKAAELRRAQEAADWQFILGDARGRRIVWDLLARAGVFKVSFVPDPYQTAFAEGGRNLGLTVLAKISEHAPASYLLMQNEAK